ncbi:hypothetical protein D1007_06692 [Hordeum vulgare]|nr:hypothetical protein D1007_06692 [Hordeum vulgare]
MYTFVSFSIEKDKRMLKNTDLEINRNKFIDMQRKWMHPYTNKEYDSPEDVVRMAVHPFYEKMKNKMNRKEDHKLWGIAPLLDNRIEYVVVDAYVTYESWKKINMIKKGLSMLQYEKQYGNNYEYYI